MMRITRIAVTAIALAAASNAVAQTTDTDLDRAEARLDRPERTDRAASRAAGLTEAAAPVRHWTLTFGLPFSFNSNVANAQSNTDQAFHADPTIGLEGNWSLGPTTHFFVEASADADIYTRHSENDGAALYGRAGFRFGDATQSIAPYVHYTIISLYAGQFDSHDVTTHYFTIGAKRTFLSGDGLRRFTIDANILRREATVRTVEQNRAAFTATFGQDLDPEGRTSWSLSGRAQVAHYTGGTAQGRDDLTLRAAVGISHALSPHVSLDGQIYFQRNWSDRAGKDYSVWDIGPTLSLSTTF